MSAAKAAAITVLADANILVKDVVSNVLYDLHAAGVISLYWTPEIESEAVENRARLRAVKQGRNVEFEDLLWSSTRFDIIKKYLVKNPHPKGWVEFDTVNKMKTDSAYAGLSAVPCHDLHVAMAAAHLAKSQGKAVTLATENLRDLQPDVLKSFRVSVMHQGVLLELLYSRNPVAVGKSLLKTMSDFNNPNFSKEMMLASIRSRNQFDNPEVAKKLALLWNVTPAKPAAKPVTVPAKKAAVRGRKGPGLAP